MGLPLHLVGPVRVRGLVGGPSRERAPKVIYPGASLLEQFRARLQRCTTEDEVHTVHLHFCGDPAVKGCSGGTLHRARRMAKARMEAIAEERRAAREAMPLIVAPW